MEMGRRDMRRGGSTNRFSKKQSGSGVSAKHKKRTLKKQEMMMCYDFPASDLENEDVSQKKIKKKSSKFLKKSLKDSNGVVHPHASVPRKLRSAMKKRNLESVSKLSSPSKRLNRSITGVESLNMDLDKKENQETDAKAIIVSESMMISKDEEEVAETLFGLADMFKETASVDNKTSDPFLSDSDKETTKDDSILVVETDFTTKDKSLVSPLSSDKTKQLDEMPLQQDHNSVNVTDAPVRAIETKAATSDINYKSNGLALWPGLSSTKLPPWMGQAISPTKKASLLSKPLSISPRNLKRCASHIYICRLIKALQTSKSNNQTEQRSSEMSQCRVPDPVSDFKSNVAPSNRYQNPHLIDLHKTCDPKHVKEDNTQLSLEFYGPHTSQKQSYNFLSLSSTGASAQSHLPSPNSFPQYPPISAAAYNSQLSPAFSNHHQMQQMSPYLASRFQTAYNANQQQQQLQKRMWAAQYRPLTSGNNTVLSKPNLSLNLASIQPLHVASSPRYNNNNVSQHQHRLMATAAMSMSHHHNNNRSRTLINRQEHHFPLIYEDTRTPLQRAV